MIEQNEMEQIMVEKTEDGQVRDDGETKRLIDEAVFLQSYIPRSLHDIDNPVAGEFLCSIIHVMILFMRIRYFVFVCCLTQR